jgi:hypothetical protein
MRKRMLISLLFFVLFGFASPLWAQSSGQYVYDALGRLTQVIDATGKWPRTTTIRLGTCFPSRARTSVLARRVKLRSGSPPRDCGKPHKYRD